MIDLSTFETPTGVVDLDRARVNAEQVTAYATQHGLSWRPHVKTHKSLTVAQIQLDAGAQGLTVATLREAEVMSSLTNDILLAYPQVGSAKLERMTRLPESIDLKVAVDSPEVLQPLAAAAEVALLARLAAETEGVDFRGVMFYPGHIRMQEVDQDADLIDVSGRISRTLEALESEGLSPQIVSGGSTPTVWRSHEMKGLTEIRSGSCIYYDREGLDLGVAGIEDIAYTVLATVVSTAVPGHAVVDAGSKALAKESRGGGGGYGIILDRPDVTVVGVSEEHGVLDLGGSDWVPTIGERVRIVPNHVCVSVNLQDQLIARTSEGFHLMQLEGRGRGAWPN